MNFFKKLFCKHNYYVFPQRLDYVKCLYCGNKIYVKTVTQLIRDGVVSYIEIKDKINNE